MGKDSATASPEADTVYYESVWECCNCADSAGMATKVNVHCPMCQHKLCKNCSRGKIARTHELREVYNTSFNLRNASVAGASSRSQFIENPSVRFSLGNQNSDLPQRLANRTSGSILQPSGFGISVQDDHMLFVSPLDQHKDSDILEHWHNCVLPAVTLGEFAGLRSLHLVRGGVSEEDSQPTVIVTCLNLEEGNSMRERILALYLKHDRGHVRICLEKAALRRTILEDPPICKAKNTLGQPYPNLGASIGLWGSTQDTATLGGFLVVDGELLILTVDHLIPDIEHNLGPIVLMQPSPQERQSWQPKHSLKDVVTCLRACCEACRRLALEYKVSGSLHHRASQFSDPPQDDCATARIYQRAKNERYLAQTKVIGDLKWRSDVRSRKKSHFDPYTEPSENVQMDWALFEVDEWPFPLNDHAIQASKALSFSKIVPGARVHATGRTSGYQLGVVNPAVSLINHGSHYTSEHSVMQRPGSGLKDWLEGGIGVDGDSGAWVIDQDSGVVYGMVWGRDLPFTTPLSLFTPMEDIITDIKERTGAQIVCLPGKEASFNVGKGKGKARIEEGTVLINAPPTTDDMDVQTPVADYGSQTGMNI